MAVNELMLVSLALSLATNPTATDVEKYKSLAPQEQVRIQQIIDKNDLLPQDVNELIIRSRSEAADGPMTEHPTAESGSGL
jgi:hypothetical protein